MRTNDPRMLRMAPSASDHTITFIHAGGQATYKGVTEFSATLNGNPGLMQGQFSAPVNVVKGVVTGGEGKVALFLESALELEKFFQFKEHFTLFDMRVATPLGTGEGLVRYLRGCSIKSRSEEFSAPSEEAQKVSFEFIFCQLDVQGNALHQTEAALFTLDVQLNINI